MDFSFSRNRFSTCHENLFRFLGYSWILGLIFGGLAAVFVSNDVSSLMHAASVSRVSIVGLLSVYLFPLLFSALAVYMNLPYLLLPICFLKAVSFSYLAMGVSIAFGSAGWLVRLLLMFSDLASFPILWWFWSRSRSGSHGSLLRFFTAALCLAAVFGSIDYCLVAPFLANLLSQ